MDLTQANTHVIVIYSYIVCFLPITAYIILFPFFCSPFEEKGNVGLVTFIIIPPFIFFSFFSCNKTKHSNTDKLNIFLMWFILASRFLSWVIHVRMFHNILFYLFIRNFGSSNVVVPGVFRLWLTNYLRSICISFKNLKRNSYIIYILL